MILRFFIFFWLKEYWIQAWPLTVLCGWRNHYANKMCVENCVPDLLGKMVNLLLTFVCSHNFVLIDCVRCVRQMVSLPFVFVFLLFNLNDYFLRWYKCKIVFYFRYSAGKWVCPPTKRHCHCLFPLFYIWTLASLWFNCLIDWRSGRRFRWFNPTFAVFAVRILWFG